MLLRCRKKRQVGLYHETFPIESLAEATFAKFVLSDDGQDRELPFEYYANIFIHFTACLR